MTDTEPACIVTVSPDKLISYQGTIAAITPPPTGDGVYTTDGSPPIGTYRWNKTTITFAIAMPKDGVLVNIPHTHNVAIAINTAFTTIELDCPLRFQHVDFTGPDCADLTICFDSGTDPIFVNNPSALAYTYFPGTKPAGKFSSVYNLKFLFDLQNVNFHYDINEIFRHELRHGIGLVHTINPVDIMYPFYSEKRRPSPMDIFQEQTIYGVRTPPVNPVEVDGFYSMDSRNIEFVA